MTVDILFILIAILAAGLGVLVGRRRRTWRTLVSLGITAVAVFGAFLLTKYWVLPAFRKEIPEMVSGISELNGIPVTTGNAAGVLLYILFAALVGSFIFLVVFGVLRLLLLIPDCIIRHQMKKRETEEYRQNTAHRTIGAVAGGLGALLLVLPFLIAFAGPVRMYQQSEEITDRIARDDITEEYPDGNASGGVIQMIYSVFSLPMMDSFSRTTYAGEEESLRILADNVQKKLGIIVSLVNELDAYSGKSQEDEKKAEAVISILTGVEKLGIDIGEDALLRDFLADLIECLPAISDGSLPLSAETLKNLAESLRANDGSFQKVLGAVKNAAAIAVRLSTGEVDSTAMAESIAWLSENLDRQTAQTVKEAASSALAEMGNETSAQVMTNAFSDFCDLLTESDNMTLSESQKNAEALPKLYAIIEKLNALDASQKDVFDIVIPSADEIVRDICEASLISQMAQNLAFDRDGNPVDHPMGGDVQLSDTDSEKLQNAMDSYKSSHPDVNLRTLDAIAHIFNL